MLVVLGWVWFSDSELWVLVLGVAFVGWVFIYFWLMVVMVLCL